MNLSHLYEFCTVRQLEVVQAIEKAGSIRGAAKALSINFSTAHQNITLVKKKAALRGRCASPQLHAQGQTAFPLQKLKILVLPDVQARPGIDFAYLRKIGIYAVEKRVDVIVCIGDFADMESLSSYDKGKKSFEGRRFNKDIEAAKDAMCEFLTPIWEYNKKADKEGLPPFNPRKVMLLGNHEDRINRAVNEDPKLDGLISVDKCLEYHVDGWEVHPFLEVVSIGGVAFSHYFQTGTMGRPASTAQAQLNKKHQSCIAGHQQGLQIASGFRADGSMIWSIIAGSCYEHDEDYLGPQGNKHWRGFLVLHEVIDGAFDPMFVSLNFINQKYAEMLQ